MSKRIDLHDLVDMIENPVYVYHTDINMGECKILEYIHREKVNTLDFIMIIFDRQTSDICNDDTLNECLSVEKLDDWFNKKNIDISDYKMVKYVGEPVYRFEDGSCLFRKSSSVKI